MSINKQKVVITGHKGFIGTKLFDALQEKGLNPVGVDLLGDTPVDIRDLTHLQEVCQGATCIYHLAAISSYSACESNTKLAIETNVLATKNIFKIAKLNNSKVIFTSSASIYGDRTTPCSESSTPTPQGLYASTKLQGEVIAKEYASLGVASSCLRLFNVYGPQDPPKNVISRFLFSAQQNLPIEIYGDGKQVRDFIFLDDVIACLLKVRTLTYRPMWPSIGNVGTGQGTSILTLAKAIIGLTGSTSEIILKDQQSGTKMSVADLTFSQNLYTSTPRNILTGLEELING